MSDPTTKDEMTEKQRQYWNTFSGFWKKWDNFIMEWLRPIGEKLLKLAELKDGYVVLDVATGTGEPGLTAAKRIGSGRVIGIDLSQEMVKLAQDKARMKGIGNYEVRVCDVSALPFEAGSFDAVICRHGIMFFPVVSVGMKELVRAIKPGRRLCASVWGPRGEKRDAIQEILNGMLELPPAPPDSPGPYRFSGRPGSLTSFLTEAGLHQVEEVEMKGEVTYESQDQYWEWLTDSFQTEIEKIDEEKRRRMRQEIAQTLGLQGKNERISFEWTAWVAYGIK